MANGTSDSSCLEFSTFLFFWDVVRCEPPDNSLHRFAKA